MTPLYLDIINGATKKFAPKKVKNIQAEHVCLTPDEARHILKYYNTLNRKPSTNIAKKYAADMQNGRWKDSGETISFDKKGNLLNGQHRLMALAMSEFPRNFVVVYGLDSDSFEVIDNGKVRTNADILGMKGYDTPAILNGLTRSILAYKEFGQFDASARRFGGASDAITKSQVLEYIDGHPDLMDFVGRYRKNQLISASTAAFCYWLLSSVDKDVAEAYLDEILLGINLQPDTIEHYLFTKLQRNRNAAGKSMNKTSIIANIILGWKRHTGISQSKKMYINWDSTNGLPSLT